MKSLIESINAASKALATDTGYPDERFDVVYRASFERWFLERHNLDTGKFSVLPFNTEIEVRAFLEDHNDNLKRLQQRGQTAPAG